MTFRMIKELLTNTPILTLPMRFIVYRDVSGIGLGCGIHLIFP